MRVRAREFANAIEYLSIFTGKDRHRPVQFTPQGPFIRVSVGNDETYHAEYWLDQLPEHPLNERFAIQMNRMPLIAKEVGRESGDLIYTQESMSKWECGSSTWWLQYHEDKERKKDCVPRPELKQQLVPLFDGDGNQIGERPHEMSWDSSFFSLLTLLEISAESGPSSKLHHVKITKRKKSQQISSTNNVTMTCNERKLDKDSGEIGDVIFDHSQIPYLFAVVKDEHPVRFQIGMERVQVESGLRRKAILAKTASRFPDCKKVIDGIRGGSNREGNITVHCRRTARAARQIEAAQRNERSGKFVQLDVEGNTVRMKASHSSDDGQEDVGVVPVEGSGAVGSFTPVSVNAAYVNRILTAWPQDKVCFESRPNLPLVLRSGRPADRDGQLISLLAGERK